MLSYAKWLLFLLISLCYIGFAYSKPALYKGDPAINKLNPSLANTDLFKKAPPPKIKHLNYLSYEKPGDKPYSHYQINPVVTKGFKTRYFTVEQVAEGWRFPGISLGQTAIVHGKGISFGGIYWPLELMTVKNKQGKIIYYNKIAITSMHPLSGHLFPLKVGNNLKFHFTRIHLRHFGNKTTTEHDSGIMEYKVVSKQSHYPHSKTPVPGPVYTIDVLESTKRQPKYHLTDIYDYAPALGWYISDNYFAHHKMYASYYLQSWS